MIADMYTTPALRLAACAAPLKLCSLTDAGASADAPDPYRYCRGDQEDARKQSVHNPCVNQVELAIQTAPKLDRSLALCSSCLLLEVNTLREKGEKATPLSSCRPEVCAEACAHFPTFATQLRELSSATSLCAWIEQCGPVSGYDGGTGECAAEVLRTNGAGELVANCLNCVISGGTCESAYGLAAVEADAGISGELSAGCKTVCEGVPSFHGASVAPDI